VTQASTEAAAGHGPHDPSIDIVINGTQHTVSDKKLSYEQVVGLAYDGNPPTGANVMIVVTYARGESGQKGTLVAGQEVPVHKGMVFNVYDATES
jgi:hypothetical protein